MLSCRGCMSKCATPGWRPIPVVIQAECCTLWRQIIIMIFFINVFPPLRCLGLHKLFCTVHTLEHLALAQFSTQIGCPGATRRMSLEKFNKSQASHLLCVEWFVIWSAGNCRSAQWSTTKRRVTSTYWLLFLTRSKLHQQACEMSRATSA